MLEPRLDERLGEEDDDEFFDEEREDNDGTEPDHSEPLPSSSDENSGEEGLMVARLNRLDS